MNVYMSAAVFASALVLSLLCLSVKGRYCLHMYQLSSYYVGRLSKWQIKNISAANIVCGVLCALMCVLGAFVSRFFILGAAALSLAVTVFYKAPVQKKKMVYTHRVKRQICVFYTLFAGLSALCFAALFLGANILSCILLAVLCLSCHLPFIWVSISGICNLPIEACVQKYYVSDAEKILSKNPSLKVIGVTGSYGKTSTKYMLGAVLSQKYNTLVTPESYNTLMGIVKTVRSSLSALHQVFVVEMGAKHVGEIGQMARLVKPQSALITTVGIQHLETFGSEENIVKAKFELVDALGNDGVAFLNYDCDKIKDNNRHENTVTFGMSSERDYFAEDIVCTDRGTEFTLCCKDGRRISLSTKLLGRHNVQNLVSACAVGLEMGVSEGQLKAAAASLTPVPHRLELRSTGAYTVIDNAFNSNPSGAAESLYVLSRFEGYTKIIVTPGFIELGARQKEESFDFGRKIAAVCDGVILVGDKITRDIREGIEHEGFGGTLYVADTLNEALGMIALIGGDKKAVLFENDLPDNYEAQGTGK